MNIGQIGFGISGNQLKKGMVGFVKETHPDFHTMAEQKIIVLSAKPEQLGETTAIDETMRNHLTAKIINPLNILDTVNKG